MTTTPPEAGKEKPRPVTAQEDRMLRNAAKASAKLVAVGVPVDLLERARQALTNLLQYSGTPKRDEWPTEEAFRQHVAADANARAVLAELDEALKGKTNGRD